MEILDIGCQAGKMHVSNELYRIASKVLSQCDDLTTSRVSACGNNYSSYEVVIDVDGSTGWHYHTGDVHIYVQSGTLTQVYAGRRKRVFHAGDHFVEKGGFRNVRKSRNDGVEPVVLHALYISSPPTNRSPPSHHSVRPMLRF